MASEIRWTSLYNDMCACLCRLFEVFLDCAVLLLARSSLVTLQSRYHYTLLLYCSHSNPICIATDWFAVMNDSVHAVLYGYFEITATEYGKFLSPVGVLYMGVICIEGSQLRRSQKLYGCLVLVNNTLKAAPCRRP